MAPELEEYLRQIAPREVGPRLLTRDDLRSYQDRLSDRLYLEFGKKPGALLAMQMSLGKTATTATAMRDLLDSFQIRRVLIVAPLRVAQKTWPDELAEWQHLKPLKWKPLVGKIGDKVTAAQRLRWLNEFLADPTMEIAIINRENVVWLYRELKKRKKWPFDVLIYDESSRLKEGRKRTAKTKNITEFGALAAVRKQMDYVIELTGTPTPNGLIDLWGQAYIIDQGERLGTTKQAFLDRWFTSDYKGWHWTPRPNAEREIMERMSDIMVSLKTRDVINLPPVIASNVMVDLTPKQMKDYRRFVRELALEEHDIEAVNKGVLTGKLLQYANGSVYRNIEDSDPPRREVVHIHDHKLDALDSIVAETGGANLLVAYSYKFDLARIKKKYPYAREATEAGVLDDWNKGKVRMLLAHPASIGHGMNLQFGGNHVVWYGLNSSLELYQQFNARLPRPGQTADKVFIYHILAEGTFDVRLIGILGDKDATQERITQAVQWQLSVESQLPA